MPTNTSSLQYRRFILSLDAILKILQSFWCTKTQVVNQGMSSSEMAASAAVVQALPPPHEPAIVTDPTSELLSTQHVQPPALESNVNEQTSAQVRTCNQKKLNKRFQSQGSRHLGDWGAHSKKTQKFPSRFVWSLSIKTEDFFPIHCNRKRIADREGLPTCVWQPLCNKCSYCHCAVSQGSSIHQTPRAQVPAL